MGLWCPICIQESKNLKPSDDVIPKIQEEWNKNIISHGLNNY